MNGLDLMKGRRLGPKAILLQQNDIEISEIDALKNIETFTMQLPLTASFLKIDFTHVHLVKYKRIQQNLC